MYQNTKTKKENPEKKNSESLFMKKITRDYILGFTDGEGCFSLHITKRTQNLFGFFFTPSFSLSQNTTSKQVLEEIQSFFKCGFHLFL